MRCASTGKRPAILATNDRVAGYAGFRLRDEIVAVQVQLRRLVARECDLDLLALRDADRFGVGLSIFDRDGKFSRRARLCSCDGDDAYIRNWSQDGERSNRDNEES
jgi:hypothetical protein